MLINSNMSSDNDNILFGADEKAKAKASRGSKASEPGVVSVDEGGKESSSRKHKDKHRSSSGKGRDRDRDRDRLHDDQVDLDRLHPHLLALPQIGAIREFRLLIRLN